MEVSLLTNSGGKFDLFSMLFVLFTQDVNTLRHVCVFWKKREGEKKVLGDELVRKLEH